MACGNGPVAAFTAFTLLSLATYLPLHLAFGDGDWFQPGHIRFRSRPAGSCFMAPRSSRVSELASLTCGTGYWLKTAP